MTPQEATDAARNQALVHAELESVTVLAQVLRYDPARRIVLLGVCRAEHTRTTQLVRLDPDYIYWRTIV